MSCEHYLVDLKDNVLRQFLTGSRVTTHATSVSDYDYVVLVKDADVAHLDLLSAGWRLCGKDEYDRGLYLAYRKGEVNLLVSANHVYVAAMEAATTLLRALNYVYKQDRYDLFVNVKQLAGI